MSHLIDASVGRPAVANVDVAVDNLALGALLQEGVEVILHGGEVGPGLVAHGREEDGRLGVPAGDDAAVPGGEGGVPQLEERPDLGLGDVVLAGLGGLVELLELAEAEEVERRVGAGDGSGDEGVGGNGPGGGRRRGGREGRRRGGGGEGDGERGELHGWVRRGVVKSTSCKIVGRRGAES